MRTLSTTLIGTAISNIALEPSKRERLARRRERHKLPGLIDRSAGAKAGCLGRSGAGANPGRWSLQTHVAGI